MATTNGVQTPSAQDNSANPDPSLAAPTPQVGVQPVASTSTPTPGDQAPTPDANTEPDVTAPKPGTDVAQDVADVENEAGDVEKTVEDDAQKASTEVKSLETKVEEAATHFKSVFDEVLSADPSTPGLAPVKTVEDAINAAKAHVEAAAAWVVKVVTHQYTYKYTVSVKDSDEDARTVDGVIQGKSVDEAKAAVLAKYDGQTYKTQVASTDDQGNNTSTEEEVPVTAEVTSISEVGAN